jgi:hypothetical protein
LGGKGLEEEAAWKNMQAHVGPAEMDAQGGETAIGAEVVVVTPLTHRREVTAGSRLTVMALSRKLQWTVWLSWEPVIYMIVHPGPGKTREEL